MKLADASSWSHTCLHIDLPDLVCICRWRPVPSSLLVVALRIDRLPSGRSRRADNMNTSTQGHAHGDVDAQRPAACQAAAPQATDTEVCFRAYQAKHATKFATTSRAPSPDACGEDVDDAEQPCEQQTSDATKCPELEHDPERCTLSQDGIAQAQHKMYTWLGLQRLSKRKYRPTLAIKSQCCCPALGMPRSYAYGSLRTSTADAFYSSEQLAIWREDRAAQLTALVAGNARAPVLSRRGSGDGGMPLKHKQVRVHMSGLAITAPSPVQSASRRAQQQASAAADASRDCAAVHSW